MQVYNLCYPAARRLYFYLYNIFVVQSYYFEGIMLNLTYM